MPRRTSHVREEAMIKLYDIVCKNDNFPEKDIRDLYVKNAGREKSLQRGDTLDFLTYFNSFSSVKWKKYTTIKEVSVELYVQGDFEITFVLQDGGGKRFLLSEEIKGGHYVKSFPIEEVGLGILGFQLRSLSDEGSFISGAYYGEFDVFERKTVGVGICTYKREEFVLKNIEVLKGLRQKLPELELVVVDNGRTLKVQDPDVCIIPNKNFGGSGGFTRAIIEYMERENRVDYILLMDDDVVIEPSAILRMWSFLSGLRREYRDRFLSGAMLMLSKPCVQFENSAYWARFKLRSKGCGMDMRDARMLVRNEIELNRPNQYGAWWFCCIPSHRVGEIGYPLPVFIKGDDIEFGLRNDRPLITMNGIAVWHQDFDAKQSPVQNYYAERNSPMMNNFARGCNFLTFAITILGRMVKRFLRHDRDIAKMLYLSLHDYNKGLYGITSVGADEGLRLVQEYAARKVSGFIFVKVFFYALYTVALYPKTHKIYLKFREQKLKDASFWKHYLGIA